MSKPYRHIVNGALVALLSGLALGSAGCAVGYRVYDPEFSTYHRWDRNEDLQFRFYLDSRHEPYRSFRSLDEHQQRDYWRWRHDHGNADHH